LNAQTVSFTMNHVGEFPETPSILEAIQFTRTGSCIDVQIGETVLEGVRGSRLNDTNCEMPSDINTLGINMYPDPSVSQTSNKFIQTLPITQTFNVSEVKVDAVILMTNVESGDYFFAGKPIDVSSISIDSNNIKLESTHYAETTQFIYTNN